MMVPTTMDCRVVVEAAIPVYDVSSSDEAVRIAISKTGEMLNPDLNYVEIEMGERTSPSGEELEPAFIVADEALVALELEMTVFNVEREEHAARIARKEIGQRLENIPLEVLEVEILETNEEDEEDEESEAEDETGSETEGAESAGSDSGDDVLPEFDDLLESSNGDDRNDTER